MKRLLPACLLVCALSGAAEEGALFDFRNDVALYTALAGQSGPVSFTNNGMVATFTASDGTMNRTASGFGLNSTIPGDDTDAFDVGEWIDVTFGSGVTLTTLSVSSWSTANGDEATLYVGGTNSAIITNTGNHALNICVAAGEVLRISCSAGTIGNGWSLEGIAVQNLSSVPSNIPPVLDPIGDKTVFESQPLSFTVTALDPIDNDPVTLSATGLPPGAVFTKGIFTWNNAAAGSYSVTFYATDKDGTDSEPVTITVAAAVTGSSRIARNFYGWSGDTIFKLINGQFWQQSVSGSKVVSPALYRPYMTITNYLGTQRRMVVTNVTGYVVVAPLAVTESAVTNSFAGLHYQNIYRLADGTIWKQISFENISGNASSVTAWRWIKEGKQMMRFLDRNDLVIGTCAVEASAPPVDIKTHSTIDGYFYGFGYGNIFPLADGSWWKQISFERSASTRRNPEVLVWNESEMDYLEMPDEDLQVSVEEMNVQFESAITNTFAGLHYGNTYRLADGSDWLQLSFETVSTNATNPNVVLWIEGTQANLLVRDRRDATVGTCIVDDPISDSDSDGQSNAAEVLAGFDPLDSQSAFRLYQTDRYVLSWDAVEGRIYTIEWSPSLTERFRPLETSIVWPQNSWTDTVHAVETTGFYRIGVRLAE